MRNLASFLLSLVAAAALCVPARAQLYTSIQPSDPVGAMQRARELVAAGKLDEAILRLRFYVATHPGEVGPERLLGDLYFRRSDLTQSERTYQHILLYASTDKETHSRLGSVYAAENRIDDAIREFNRSLPGTAAVEDLVQLHIRRGDFAEYKHEREDAVDQNPFDPEALTELGELYQTIGQPEVAQRLYRRALVHDRHSLIALNGLGLAYESQRLYSEAIATFNSCLQVEKDNYACMTNLGGTYLHLSQWTNARTTLEQAHKIFPERGEALVNLGYLYDAQGDWKQAVTYYVDATTADPFEADAYLDLGATYEEHNQEQLAQAALIKGLSVAPDNGRLHFALGEVYSREGNSTMAAAQYRAAAIAQDLDASFRQAAQERVTALRPKPQPTP